MKQCTGCKKVLPLDSFWKRKYDSKDGHNRRCKECMRDIQNKYTNKSFLLSKLWKARTRAKKNGIPFDLTKEDIQKLWDDCSGTCEILKIKMEPTIQTGKWDRWNCPSLDKIDPSKGYKKGNVRIISHKANTLKGDATLEQVQSLLDYMKKYSGENK